MRSKDMYTHTSLAPPMVIAFASTPFSLSNFDANCWVRASGNFKSKRSKPKGIGLFFVKAYHHPTQKSRNQAAGRCLRVQHVKNQVAARVTAHFFATHNCYCFIITSRKNEILDWPLNWWMTTAHTKVLRSPIFWKLRQRHPCHQLPLAPILIFRRASTTIHEKKIV